jgi:hypothetical protein
MLLAVPDKPRKRPSFQKQQLLCPAAESDFTSKSSKFTLGFPRLRLGIVYPNMIKDLDASIVPRFLIIFKSPGFFCSLWLTTPLVVLQKFFSSSSL